MANGEGKEKSADIVPVAEPIQTIGGAVISGQNFDAMLAQAEKYVKFASRIRELALTVTSAADWIDQDGKPYLEWAGASKIAQTFGVSYGSPTFERETGEDEKGAFIVFHCSGNVTYMGRFVPEIGTGSSRDPFFGKAHGAFLPLSEIDMTDVKKKALTNFFNRGLKSLLGLSFTWEEIAEITKGKITALKCTKVEHDKAGSDTPETTEKRKGIMDMILDMCGGVEMAAKQALIAYTAWTNGDGKKIPGKDSVKQLSEKQVPIIYEKVKKDHDEMTSKRNKAAAENGKGEPAPWKTKFSEYKARAEKNGNIKTFNKHTDDFLRDTLGKDLVECNETETQSLCEYIVKTMKEAK